MKIGRVKAMKYYELNNTLIIEDINSFNIEEILECGQCFRFEKIDELEYKIVAYGRVLNIKQRGSIVEMYPCTLDEYENIWRNYFDMDRDYDEIKIKVSENDEIMKKAVEYAGGIRLLNQEPYECLLSFIISQNNNIPRIKGIIGRMAEKYGKACDGEYLFPVLEELNAASEADLFELRMGFRAKYIRDCLDKLFSKEVDLDKINDLTTEELLEMLLKIKGVGQKVADCTMLFSMGRREVFPTDVWVKRVMEHLYFGGNDTNIKDIHTFAKNKWGSLAGYAQQYLFYYARSLKIGTEKRKK